MSQNVCKMKNFRDSMGVKNKKAIIAVLTKKPMH